MKSLEELKAIKEKTYGKVAVNETNGAKRIVVGMATCGIAAGATPVFEALTEGIKAAKLEDKAYVTQTGCIGICQYEPVIEVYESGKEKVTYVKMTAEKVKEIIEKHIKGGEPVVEYTIGASKI